MRKNNLKILDLKKIKGGLLCRGLEDSGFLRKWAILLTIFYVKPLVNTLDEVGRR